MLKVLEFPGGQPVAPDASFYTQLFTQLALGGHAAVADTIYSQGGMYDSLASFWAILGHFGPFAAISCFLS